MAIAESTGAGTEPTGRRSRGGAEARRSARQKPKIVQNPFIARQFPIYEVLSEEGLEIIAEHVGRKQLR